MNKVGAFIYCENNANTILDCIDSIINQVDMVVVVVNKSSDGSTQILDTMNKNDKLIVIKNDFEASIIECLSSAIEYLWEKNDYILVGDGDVLYNSNCMEAIFNYIKDIENNVGMIYFDYKTTIDGLSIDAYLQSFDKAKEISDIPTFVLTKRSINNVGMSDTIDGLITKITERFVGIHIPLQLCEKK